MQMKPWPVVAAPVVVSFLVVAAELPPDTWPTLAALSLACGVSALALTGTAATLASRWGFIEEVLGGLDRVYLAHKWLGVWALGLASVHLTFKAGLDVWQSAAIIELDGGTRRLVRQLSFVALMFIVLLALNRNIPYRIWRLWHKSSGPLFVIIVLHWLSFPSPLALNTPAGVWMAAVSVLGLAGAAYKLLLYPFVARHAEYLITQVEPGAGAVRLELSPVRGGIAVEPGQFGFLRMKHDGLREPHPFTIASGGPPEGPVALLIRALGDYTRELVRQVKPGMHADIYGPYGRFRRATHAARELWIAGGVGISPFVAWLGDEDASGFDRVTLFYFYTPEREFPAVSVLESLAARRGVELVAISDGPASASFAERLGAALASTDPAHVQVRFCGPKGLLEQVRQRLSEHAIPERNLQNEYFEFR